MTKTTAFRFPEELWRLEEINLPTELATSLIGQTIPVDIVPEEQASTRVESDADPKLMAPDGAHWNRHIPMQVSFRDSRGKVWRIPRHWIAGDTPVESHIFYDVSREHVFFESLVFPTSYDLAEINMPPTVCTMRARQTHDEFEVRISPDYPVRVYWSGYDCRWRIPHIWRRRRIRLPQTEILAAQNVPPEVSAEFGGQIVTVNYHPGTMCCLPTQYRFRDGHGGKWPVRIEDCIIVGYGDEEQLT
ncbi:MAG TPA: hypothetical protein VFE02_18540 [Candidatus Acidoferrales bacterium]|nr:hypothetical protein [Candidatus Acidoferrales bacterium]